VKLQIECAIMGESETALARRPDPANSRLRLLPVPEKSVPQFVQCQLKLRLTKAQERELETWLYHLTSVWNWAIRKIELNAKDKIYFSRMEFRNLLAGHSVKLGIPSHVMQGVLDTAHESWSRCFKRAAGRPRLKGMRRPLNSIPFPDPLKEPKGNRLTLRGIGSLRFHKMAIPAGSIKRSRICKRASGWYLCLIIKGQPKPIERTANGIIGIDPGFGNLLTTSDGEVIEHPRELEAGAARLAQAQRGKNKRLSARIQERIRNRRKDRNHKLSRRLVTENVTILFSSDNIKGIAKRFGKSVASSGHAQLRWMLRYKSLIGGTEYIEVDSRRSTMTCSNCGAQSGPTGLSGLAVRQWRCACGAQHDRDVNAAINTLLAGAGLAHESNSETLKSGEIKREENSVQD
jgi:putative transposase